MMLKLRVVTVLFRVFLPSPSTVTTSYVWPGGCCQAATVTVTVTRKSVRRLVPVPPGPDTQAAALRMACQWEARAGCRGGHRDVPSATAKPEDTRDRSPEPECVRTVAIGRYLDLSLLCSRSSEPLSCSEGVQVCHTGSVCHGLGPRRNGFALADLWLRQTS